MTARAPPTTTPQTPEKEQTNHNMSTVLVNDVKVSSTDEDIPPTVGQTSLTAKRKLSPTPTNAQQSPAKKPKPHTPQKEQQPTPTYRGSDTPWAKGPANLLSLVLSCVFVRCGYSLSPDVQGHPRT